MKVSKPWRSTDLMNASIINTFMFIFSVTLVRAGLSLHKETFALTQFADTALEGSESIVITLPWYLKCVTVFSALSSYSTLTCASDISSTSVFGNDVSIPVISFSLSKMLTFLVFVFFCYEDQIVCVSNKIYSCSSTFHCRFANSVKNQREKVFSYHAALTYAPFIFKAVFAINFPSSTSVHIPYETFDGVCYAIITEGFYQSSSVDRVATSNQIN